MNRRYAATAVISCIAVVAFLAWWKQSNPAPTEPATIEASASLPRGVSSGTSGISKTKAGDGTPKIAAAVNANASGTVLDQTRSAAIAGAIIQVKQKDVVLAETTSGADGAFSLPCQPDSAVEVAARGYRRYRALLSCSTAQRFLLSPGATLEGNVLAPDGSPAADAKVACTEGMQSRPDVETTSNDAGEFSLTCGNGVLRLSAHHPSGAPAWQEVGEKAVGSVVSGIVLRLGKGRMLSGKVIREGGTPSAARVLLLDGTNWQRPTLIPTNESGEFSVTISRKEHTVAAIDEHGRTVRASIPAGSDDPPPLGLVLPEWLVLHGRLVGDSTDAAVTAFRDRQKMGEADPAALREQFGILLTRGTYSRNAKMDGSRFRFEGVEPGTYSLRATSKFASGETTASTSSSGEVVIVMRPVANLELRVQWEDGRAAEGHIRLSYGDGERHQVLRQGLLKANGLEVGPCGIAFTPNEGVVPDPIELPLVAGDNKFTWTVSSASITVHGTVRDAVSGAPIAGAQMSTPLDDWYGWSAGRPFVLTDEAGKFTLLVTSLDKPIFAFHEGHVSRVVPAAQASDIALTPGEAEEDVKAPDFDERLKEAKEREAARGH